MYYKIVFRYALLFAVFTTFFCGIYRHDVEKEKYLALARQPQFDCVGSVLLNGKPKGSCVLISQNYVLSAAHVFISNSQTSSKHQKIRTFDTNQVYTITFNGKEYLSEKIIIHPAYFEGYKSNYGDIVLIKLKENVSGVTPATLNTKQNELHREITCVGFGPARPANEPVTSIPYGKIAGQNILDSISGTEVNGIQSLFSFDFDNPTDSSNNQMGSGHASNLEYDPTGGDSGGGIFIQNEGSWLLAGIISHGLQRCSSKDGWYGSTCDATRIIAYKSWIDENKKE
jgi:secreted trypsin-like serine protease